MDPSRMLLVAMVAAVAATTAAWAGQVTPAEPQMESGGSNSSAKLSQTLHNISAAILDSLSRSDHSCLQVCATVLYPNCITECKRRWLPTLMCRMVCYSSEMMCCRCPTACHRPFQKCYIACAESDTSCKDHCIAEVNKCCGDNERTAHENKDSDDE